MRGTRPLIGNSAVNFPYYISNQKPEMGGGLRGLTRLDLRVMDCISGYPLRGREVCDRGFVGASVRLGSGAPAGRVRVPAVSPICWRALVNSI